MKNQLIQKQSKKERETMKTILKMFCITASLFIQNQAQASCGDGYFDGVFHNAIGDRFKVEQSDCNHLQVLDLQLNDTYRSEVGSFTLQPAPTQTGRPLSFFLKSFAVSLSLGKPQTYSNSVIQNVAVRFTIPVSSTSGFSNPIIEAQGTLFSNKSYIQMWIGSIKAIHTPGESVAQGAFITGINMGFDIMNKLNMVHFNELLVRE